MHPLVKLLLANKQHTRSFIIASSLLLVSVVLNLFQPKLIEWVIDFGIQTKIMNNIIWGGIGIFLLGIAANVLNFFSGYLLISLGQNLGFELRNSLFNKVLSFAFSNLDKWRTGELLVRMNTDINTIRMFVRMGLLMITQSFFMLLGGLVFMFFTNVRLALLLAATIPLILLLFYFVVGRLRPLFVKARDNLDRLNNVLQENLAGAKVVKAFGRQDAEIERFAVQNRNFFKVSLKVGYLVASLFPLLFFIGNLLLSGILWLGGHEVIQNILLPHVQSLTLGKLVAFNNYALLVIFPLLMLGLVLNFISMAAASAVRVEELLNEDVQILDDAQAVTLSRLEGKIEFRNVSFQYGDGEKVLDNINLVIQPGEKVGIIGPTGSGKSSLAHLILRFNEPQKGVINIDDIDIRKMAFSTLRTRVALVLQETTLFSGSIKDNIMYGKPDANAEDVAWSAHIACAADFIVQRENRWEESIGERGKGLSGGQRQRLAIARALVADPDILILDDATSSVDLETEKKIVYNLCEERVGKTTIIISQKINTIRDTDRILVFENGKIIATGTHDELLVKSGVYREIAATQSAHIVV